MPKRALFFSSIILFLTLGIPAHPSTFAGDRRPVHANGIWAKVNETILTTQEVLVILKIPIEELKKTYQQPELNKRINEEVKRYTQIWIENQLFLAEAKTRGLYVTTKLIEDEFELRVRKKAGGNLAQYEDMLERNGRTIVEEKEDIHDSLILNKLKEAVTSNKTFVMPREMKEYYHNNSDDFKEPERFGISRIYLTESTVTQPDAEGALRKKMDALQKKLDDGADFLKLAKTYTMLRPIRKTIRPGESVKDIDEALLSMKPGDTRSIIIAGNNSVVGMIIRLEKYFKPSIASFEEVRQAIFSKISQEKYKVAIDEFTKELRGKYVVVESQ